MAGSSVPNTSTRPTTPSNTTVASLRKRLETLELQVKRINANRTPEPLLVHQLANTGPMSQVSDGDTLIYNQASGQYEPGQTITFNLGNIITDSTQTFVVESAQVWDDGYFVQLFINAGSDPSHPTDGQAIFEIFTNKDTSKGIISIGVDTGPSVCNIGADTINLGALDPSTGLPDEGSGNLSFFFTEGDGQQTVTGSRGGNAALLSLITALKNYGLILDSSSA